MRIFDVLGRKGRKRKKVPPTIEKFIGPNTDINIIADSSGSMNSTLNVLNAMVTSGALKTRLLPYYNNNETLYNQRVQFFTHNSERTFNINMLNKGKRTGTKLINIVFQDETQNGGYENTNNSIYTTDVTAFRTTLNSYDAGFFVGLVFQVVGYPSFKTFLQGVKAGTAPFTSLNLSNKSEVKFTYDILGGNTQQYYVDTIIDALISLN